MLHVDIMFVILVQLFINNLLELVTTSLRNQMHVKGSLHQLVSLEPLDNFLWVIVIIVARQVHILGVVHAGALEGLKIRHQRNHFGAS